MVSANPNHYWSYSRPWSTSSIPAHLLLSSAHTDDDRVAGAFAAELLAPAEGIRRALATLETYDEDAALDVIATGDLRVPGGGHVYR
ncbi:hypothetical protein [Frankia sp. Cr2]|uniref:hypothetical protein n=1 Tax=Frankia sp. Cr2 TaxID=3073932 RepID=UPI002AD21678|nr:hypothetical protein [Frankia sp. Cr2]